MKTTQNSTAARPTYGVVSLIVLSLLAGCHPTSQEPSMKNFTVTINDFLDKRGHLCLAKYDWPIYVTTEDRTNSTRDSIQMPVLEKLGLVTGKDLIVQSTDTDSNGKKMIANARQYQLTTEGQKYYLHNPEVVATGTKRVTHPADLCAATLTLDKVIGWESPIKMNGETVTSVVYTYKITPAPWATKPEIQQVFPMVARVIEGAGTMQLREGVHLTPTGWIADEIFKR
jgi:hypothetical protein